MESNKQKNIATNPDLTGELDRPDWSAGPAVRRASVPAGEPSEAPSRLLAPADTGLKKPFIS